MKEKNESRIGELEGISATWGGAWLSMWQREPVTQAPPIITACCLPCSAPFHLLICMNLKFTFGYFHLYMADMCITIIIISGEIP